MSDDRKFGDRRGGRSGDRAGTRSPAGATRQGGDTAAAPGERIAKRLARAGIASRREAEALIEAGRVKVDGKVLASAALNVGPDAVIEVDDTPIPAIERTRLFLFHKPAGTVTTNRDPQGRRTIFDVLPPDLPRLITVGRLDINTEGLILMTNDGGLARVLELPTTGWLRRYRVRVHGEVDEAALAGLKDGIAVDGVFYGSIEAALERRQGTNAWLTIGLREGKNREVKNVLGAFGLEVARLIRVSYGPFQLADLEEGRIREIRGRMLRDQLGPRLIEEAGSTFDAPVIDRGPGPEKAAVSEKAPRAEKPGRDRKTRREDGRENALGRLDTKPKGRGDRKDAAPEPRRSRSSNVWMAPGARPTGGKKRDEEHGSAGRSGKPAEGGARGDRPSRSAGWKDRPRQSGASGDATETRHRPEGGRGSPAAGRPARPYRQDDRTGGSGDTATGGERRGPRRGTAERPDRARMDPERGGERPFRKSGTADRKQGERDGASHNGPPPREGRREREARKQEQTGHRASAGRKFDGQKAGKPGPRGDAAGPKRGGGPRKGPGGPRKGPRKP